MADKNTRERSTAADGINIPETDLNSEQIEDLLIRARVKLLIEAPFFGSIATRLQFVDATKWCPTGATDGRYFYYNRNFTAALSEEELLFLVGHEVLHCVYDHMDRNRMGNRDPKLWNVANDFVINADLVDGNIGEEIKLIKICYDWKYRGKTSEDIYDELFDEAEKNGNVTQWAPMDMHMDGDGEAGDGDDEQGTGNNDGTEGPVRYTDDELDQLSDEVRESVVQSAKAAGGAGNLPGGVGRLLDKLLNPKLDWRELLAMQIQSIIKADYNWMNPSRKAMDAGFYMPGMDRETSIDVAISVDTSGSISEDMLRDFLTEVKGIMDQYSDYTMHLWCFDTEVHNPTVFTADNGSDLLKYELDGFGGTMFECNWEYMKENDIEPKKFIMFTDGYPCGTWGDEFYCDTLFIVHGGGYGEPPQAPYGITVKYEEPEKES